MKTRHVVLVAPVILLLLATANCRQNGGAPLEGLPKEIAVNLKPIPDTEFFIVPWRSYLCPVLPPTCAACRARQPSHSHRILPSFFSEPRDGQIESVDYNGHRACASCLVEVDRLVHCRDGGSNDGAAAEHSVHRVVTDLRRRLHIPRQWCVLSQALRSR
jgi:hypothetical protein